MTLRIVSGTANRPLAEAVAEGLRLEPTGCAVERSPDGELRPTVECVRGADVYVVQPTAPPVNEHVVELLLLLDACRRSGAARLTAVVPYFGYARQDRRSRAGQAVGARVIADALAAAGTDRLVVVDPHTAALEAMCHIRVEMVTAVPVLANALGSAPADARVVVAPDLGAVLAETRQTAAAALAGLRERINGVSVDLLGTPPDDIVLAPPGTVPKTSSGKLRRAATRHRYEQGDARARPRPVWWQLARFAALDARRAVVRAAARSLARLTGTTVTVDRADRLARPTPCVVVANHTSFLDGLAMSTILPHHYTFVAGEVFAHKPLIGFVLRRIGTRFVERTEREHSVADTRHLEDAARGGERLVVFPEGCLSPVPGLRPFHMGAFVIAAHAGLPVVPVAISGTRAMM